MFSVPDNLKKFLFDYEQSRFIECNRTLANNNVKLMGANYTQNSKRNKMISGVITHISDSLESFYKHYWLAGGYSAWMVPRLRHHSAHSGRGRGHMGS